VVAAGLDMDAAAKLIGLILAAANTALIWHLLMRATNRYFYALAGTLLVVLSPQFVALHSIAMSEPPFLFFLLLTLLAFLHYLETGSRNWLIASALALGLATLARFTAPPLGAAIALCILVNPRQTFARRFWDAVIFTIVSASLFFLWTVASQLVVGRSIGRSLWFYGNMGTKEWLTSLEALTAWLLPDQLPFAVRVLVFAAFFLAAAWLTIVHTRETLRLARHAKVVDALLPLTLGLFFIFYMGFMVLSTSLEANLSLNSRYAFPAYVTTVLMVTIVVANLARARGPVKWACYALVGLGAVVLVSHSVRIAVRSEQAFRSGVGYASKAWIDSPTMAAIAKLPADATLYSNGADAIAYVLKRPASFVPEHVQLRTAIENPNKPFEVQLQQVRDTMAEGNAYVVIFDNVDWRSYLVTEAELQERLSLQKIAEEPDGRIYTVPAESKVK
jgi:hypothetical protein